MGSRFVEAMQVAAPRREEVARRNRRSGSRMHGGWMVLAFVAAAAVLLGSGQPTQAQPALGAFERAVQPVPVIDSTGAPLRFPFLGGFNRPRPQLADIDGDGDRDLFVQERGGRILFFENQADGSVSLRGDERFEDYLAFESAKYHGLDVGQWFRFADMDGDGDFDLLAEQPRNYVRYYRNTGTPTAPSFRLAADTLRTVDGAPIFADRRNRPAVLHTGCDESAPPDLFFGGLGGYLRFFRNTGVGPDGVPQLRLVSERFQGVCAGPPSVCGAFEETPRRPGQSGPRAELAGTHRQTGAGARHGANALAGGDLDGDGDQDVLWGDFFSESFYRIENTGSCDTLRLRRTADVFPPGDPVQTSGFNASDLSDLDADGDADLVFGVLGGSGAGVGDAVENLYLFEHTADGYVERTRRLLTMIDAGGESAPAFADLDADGDADLLLGADQSAGRPVLTYFERVEGNGTAGALRQVRARENPFAALPEAFSAHPAFADVDGDGDEDLALGTFSGLTLYENTGTPVAPRFSAEATFPLEDVPPGNYFAPAFADVDGDGDEDLVVGTSGGTLLLFRRDGRGEGRAASSFTFATERFGGIDAGGRAVPAFRDADADSDLDLYVGTRAGLRFYENTGAATQPLFGTGGLSPADLLLPSLVTPAFTDLDGDGRSDLVMGAESGGLLFFAGQQADDPGPRLDAEAVQIAPNPFAGRATVRFRLAESANVRLALYDARGRLLEVLFTGRVAAGQRVGVPLRAGTRASGVYFLRLTHAGSGEAIDTGRAVLVR